MTAREKLSKVFGLHTAWHEAPAGNDKMVAWEALVEEVDAQVMDSVLWLARVAFRQQQAHDPLKETHKENE